MEAPAPTLSAFHRPPPHGVVRDWFGADGVARLLDYAVARRDEFRPAGVGNATYRVLNPERRISHVLRRLPGLETEVRDKVAALLPAMTARLQAPAFTPAKFEIELVAHHDGAFFARHIDTFVKNGPPSTRVISAVYYFHRQPRAFSGGALRLMSLAGTDAPGTYVDVPPDNDTLVFFPSWYPHEVLKVLCPSGEFSDSRFAINCWVHR